MRCGLLGRTLGHSYSPQIHSQLGTYAYDLFEVEPEDLEAFLKSGSFHGLNVTIPYKKAVIPYLNALTPIAQELGAVNTIIRQPNGRLLGHNTDYFGFLALVRSSGLDLAKKKVLVLGSGGASNMAVAALQSLNAQPVVISRRGKYNYENLGLHEDASAIVNATPVGMYPNTGVSPVDLSRFPHLEGVLDLIYNPARTQLLLDAEARGLIAVNGLKMLVAQAWESSQWFQGALLPEEKIASIYRSLRSQMENLVLIGMPGCGKSTLGALAAEKLGKKFVDADALLEEKYGPIPEIITRKGEAYFRQLETEVLSELGKQSSLVIATGGGCVTRSENYPLLHQNGRIVFIRRPLSQLPTEGRPLSQQQGLEALYHKRLPLYTRFADEAVDNSGSLSEAVQKIESLWRKDL